VKKGKHLRCEEDQDYKLGDELEFDAFPNGPTKFKVIEVIDKKNFMLEMIPDET